MSYSYPFNINIRDSYQLELFLYSEGYKKVYSIDSNGTGNIIINYTEALNEEELSTLTNLIFNVYTNPYPNETSNSKISIKNSSNIALTAYEIFEGEYEDITNYSSVSFLIDSNQSSIKDGIEIYFSTNGLDSHFIKKYSYFKNSSFVEIISTVAKYFKIVYKNGGTSQTSFTLQTIYHTLREPNIHSTTQQPTVKIEEEDSNMKTKGHFRTHGFSITANPNTTTTHDFIFNYDIAPLSIKFTTNESHKGDIINLHIAPDVVIGVVLQNTSIGNNYFYITPSSFDWLSVGYRCKLTLGETSQDLGEVIDIDYSTGKVTVENNLENIFTVGSLVKMTVVVMKNYIISEPAQYNIGDSKIGASFIPKGNIVRLIYTNNTNSSKLFIWNTDMLY